jgi:hypothetical protein
VWAGVVFRLWRLSARGFHTLIGDESRALDFLVHALLAGVCAMLGWVFFYHLQDDN